MTNGPQSWLSWAARGKSLDKSCVSLLLIIAAVTPNFTASSDVYIKGEEAKINLVWCIMRGYYLM